MITSITNASGMTFTQGNSLLRSGLFEQLTNARTNLNRYRTSDARLAAFYIRRKSIALTPNCSRAVWPQRSPTDRSLLSNAM